MKSSDLTDHTLCRLGKWYYSDAAAPFRAHTQFKDIEDPHKKVHHHGIEAAKCFETGRIDAGMEHYALLDAASEQVIANLKALIEIDHQIPNNTQAA